MSFIKGQVTYRRMPLAKMEAAANVSPSEYPQMMPCLACGYAWMQHKGTLCPQRPGGMQQVLRNGGTPEAYIELVPVLPIWGDTTFIPDVAYFNQNPDFDVE